MTENYRCRIVIERARDTQALYPVPLFGINACLPEDFSKQRRTDIFPMRIWYTNFQRSFDHKKMTATGVRAVESEAAEPLDKLPPGNWVKHEARADADRA